MVHVAVRYKEADATIQFLPRQVTVDQILRRFDDTPFTIKLGGPIVTVMKTQRLTLRSWIQRGQSSAASSSMLSLHVERSLNKRTTVARQVLSVPISKQLKFNNPFKLIKKKRPTTKVAASRFTTVARNVVRKGQQIVPVEFRITLGEGTPKMVKGKLDAVLYTASSGSKSRSTKSTGVALVGGALELKLAHLCDQRGCVDHLHRSLAAIDGVAGVRPHPSLKNPSATVFLRAGQAVDIWALREKLRDRGIEVIQVVPGQLPNYQLRVELPRWRMAKQGPIQQCLECRDTTLNALRQLSWARQVQLSGGGISLVPTKPSFNVLKLITPVTDNSVAPEAIWLVPKGVALPKSAKARLAQHGHAKLGGSAAHPILEFQFRHGDSVGDVTAILNKRGWTSRSETKQHKQSVVTRAAIGDRKFANVSLVVKQFRSIGQLPRKIRMSNFGDLRIQIEFAHVCGEIVYSKPPKPKKQKKKKNKPKKGKSKKVAKKKPKKPFVPKPLRPAKSSHARKAIEAAIAKVNWVQQGIFHDYHTRPRFNGPRKLTLALQVQGKDDVPLDALIDALRRAGFPPKSVIVSRLFPGLPFAKALPQDLEITDQQGKKRMLASLKKPGRPLVVAFVSLKCKRYKKYKPDAKYFDRFADTMRKYEKRVDFVTISANPNDKFKDVVQFLGKTKLKTTPWHDASGKLRKVFNAQETPPPHIFVFDAAGRFRYAGDPHIHWEKPKKKSDDYLAKAIDLVIAGKFKTNGAVFFNVSKCNCSDPKCKCPKCGCGPSCRCAIRH